MNDGARAAAGRGLGAARRLRPLERQAAPRSTSTSSGSSRAPTCFATSPARSRRCCRRGPTTSRRLRAPRRSGGGGLARDRAADRRGAQGGEGVRHQEQVEGHAPAGARVEHGDGEGRPVDDGGEHPGPLRVEQLVQPCAVGHAVLGEAVELGHGSERVMKVLHGLAHRADRRTARTRRTRAGRRASGRVRTRPGCPSQAQPGEPALLREVDQVHDERAADAAPARGRGGVHRLDLAVPVPRSLSAPTPSSSAVDPVADEGDRRVHERVDVEGVHLLGRAERVHQLEMAAQQRDDVRGPRVVGGDRSLHGAEASGWRR